MPRRERSKQSCVRFGAPAHERRDADPAGPIRVLVAMKPVDFRKGMDCSAGEGAIGDRSVLGSDLLLPLEARSEKVSNWQGKRKPRPVKRVPRCAGCQGQQVISAGLHRDRRCKHSFSAPQTTLSPGSLDLAPRVGIDLRAKQLYQLGLVPMRPAHQRSAACVLRQCQFAVPRRLACTTYTLPLRKHTDNRPKGKLGSFGWPVSECSCLTLSDRPEST